MRLAFTLSLVAASAAAGPCQPHAVLTGDPQAVKMIGAELVKLGVVVDDHPLQSCKSIQAEVQLAEVGFAVAVEHGMQSEGRTVGDAVVAATWIDSWLQDDFGGAVTPTQLAAAPLAEPQPELLDQRADVTERRSARGLDVSAAFDQAWTTDGQRWSGITAGACGRFGAWCFGAKGRYAAQSELYGQTAASRSDLAVLATASRTTTIGRLQLVPELGLGVGRTHTARIDGCRRIETCDPHDQGCMVPQADVECIDHDPEHAYTLLLGDHLETSTITPRVAATFRLAIALATDWWLDGSLSAMIAPFAHRDPFALPGGTPSPYGIPSDQLALPGESLGTLELGIGLRWGAF